MATDVVAPWAETVLFTANDLTRLPDDGWQYELVDGRLVRSPPPGAEHGGICLNLGMEILRFVKDHSLGAALSNDTGFLLSQPGDADTVLAPDLSFISRKTMAPSAVYAERGYLHIAPDLVVEVASPSQHRPELSAKAIQWLNAGVQKVWIVWPEQRQVDVWEPDSDDPSTLESTDSLEGGTVLPGFRLRLSQLWEPASLLQVARARCSLSWPRGNNFAFSYVLYM